MTWQLCIPQSPEDFADYYQLRFQVLREPWGQPRGSEQDELEAQSAHRMIRAADGAVLAVGRLHRLEDGRAQVRYMAVADSARGLGLGAVVLQALELQAQQWQCHAITLNARENAIGFYLKQGYQAGESLAPLYGIPHQQMVKTLSLNASSAQYAKWCTQLQETFWQTIPLSAFMQLKVQGFDGYQLRCQAPLAPNKNLHQTMFAGSIYSLLTLTGWGLVYLQLQALGLTGDIVLSDASIRYLKPVSDDAQACAQLRHSHGDLTALRQGKRVRQRILIQACVGELVLAELDARFAVLPQKNAAQSH